MIKCLVNLHSIVITATQAEVKRAFRKLAMEYHPDRNKNADAEVKFREIAKAYEILSDKEKRKQYDQFGSGAFDGTGQAHAGAGAFSDFDAAFDMKEFFRHFDESFRFHQDEHQRHHEDERHFRAHFGNHVFDMDDLWHDFDAPHGFDDFHHHHDMGGGGGMGGGRSMFGPGGAFHDHDYDDGSPFDDDEFSRTRSFAHSHSHSEHHHGGDHHHEHHYHHAESDGSGKCEEKVGLVVRKEKGMAIFFFFR